MPATSDTEEAEISRIVVLSLTQAKIVETPPHLNNLDTVMPTAIISAMWETWVGGSQSQAALGRNVGPYPKITKAQRGWGDWDCGSSVTVPA
jgi:hypothetical protein